MTDAHRELFCSLNDHSDQAVADHAAAIASPSFDLVLSTADENVICGAPFQSTTAATTITHKRRIGQGVGSVVSLHDGLGIYCIFSFTGQDENER